MALAGLGQHGRRYAQHLLAGDVPDARLVAVTQRSRERGDAFAREHGVRFHASIEELARDPAVDLVVIALPPGEHPHAVEAVARHGRALLLEKPIAVDAATAWRLVEIVRAAGIHATVAQTLRFDPLLVCLRDEARALGRIQMIAWSQRFEPAARAWLDEPGHGGLVYNTGVHGADAMRFLTGARVQGARAWGRAVATLREADVFVAALVLEPGSILATLDNGRATLSRSIRVEIVGERGQLTADLLARRLELVSGSERAILPAPAAVPTVREALRQTVAAVLAGAPEPIPLEEGAEAVAACAFIEESLQRGGLIARPPSTGSVLS